MAKSNVFDLKKRDESSTDLLRIKLQGLEAAPKLGTSAQKRWRKLRGFKLLAEVIRGVQFKDNEKLIEGEHDRNVLDFPEHQI